MQSEIDARHLQDSIVLPGFLPNWKIPDLISKCDAMIYMKDGYMTSQHGSIVLREMISCGASIICSAESTQGLNPDHCAAANLHVIDPSSADDICEAMIAAPNVSRPTNLGFDAIAAHQAYIGSWEAILMGAMQ